MQERRMDVSIESKIGVIIYLDVVPYLTIYYVATTYFASVDGLFNRQLT